MTLIDRIVSWLGYETRSYTDIVVDAYLQRATGISPSSQQINLVVSKAQASIEAAVGYWSRAFSLIRVVPGLQIGADMLAEIGRGLCLRGESLWHIDRTGPRLRYRVVSTYVVKNYGGKDFYQLTLASPDRLMTLDYVDPRDVLHFKYSIDPIQPWRGIGPLSWAAESVALLANTESHLSREMLSAVGNLLPQPSPPGSQDVVKLKDSLKGLDGRTAVVQSQRTSWGQGSGAASDWRLVRLGADPKEAAVRIREQVSEMIMMACGIPRGLILERAGQAGPRDSWRIFLISTVTPMVAQCQAEIVRKFGIPVKMSAGRLGSSDIATLSRAVGTLVQAGMDLKEALEVTGLEDNEYE